MVNDIRWLVSFKGYLEGEAVLFSEQQECASLAFSDPS